MNSNKNFGEYWNNNASIEWYEKRYFTEILMSLRNEYDAIIYVSPEGVEIEDNGVRETDIEYRNLIDFIIKHQLDSNKWRIKNLVNIKGSTEERIAQVKSALSL